MGSIGVYIAIAVAVIIIAVFLLNRKKYSTFNTSPVKVCGGSEGANQSTSATCNTYNVHNLHHDREAAAQLLHDVQHDMDILMQHLKSKYNNSQYKGGLNPSKENRIDVIPISNMYLDPSSLNDVYSTDYIQERISQLLERYDRDSVYEISPLNKDNLTSYTENKGEQLILCLRKKTPNADGQYELHDKNTINFVVIHELTHIANDTWGHGDDFWKLFDFLLENAVEAGIYRPVNYAKEPINYCGLDLNYNPLWDRSL